MNENETEMQQGTFAIHVVFLLYFCVFPALAKALAYVVDYQTKTILKTKNIFLFHRKSNFQRKVNAVREVAE
jgi:hypothetical protein